MNENNEGFTDPHFSRLRAADLHPEAVVSRKIRDGLAQIDEGVPPNQHELKKLAGMTLAMAAAAVRGVFELEQQIIDLRDEIRRGRAA
ncbi:MAG: hypothetical protein QOE52_4381 [Mycobacterium sp.]|jgi:hypothetical protein|nr:hypothetical protein [Mycobacterium sp.]MDT5345197.1 hypothetical protein [Mycobacterium sp.]